MEKRAVLGKGVQRIEHLDGNQNRKRQGGGLLLPFGKVVTGFITKRHATKIVDFEILPFGTMPPVGQLLKSDECVAVAGVIEDIPVRKYADCGEANVHTDDHVAKEDPRSDELVVSTSGRAFHDVFIGRVESQSGGRWSVGNEVNP